MFKRFQDYDQFDLANEIDKLEQFLKVEAPNSNENDLNNVSEEIQSKVIIIFIMANFIFVLWRMII